MQVRNPDYEAFIRGMFSAASFIAHLGIEVIAIEPGVVRTALLPRAEHLQQDGYVHAGVIATLADHSAGAAAGTLIMPTQIILTSEFKIHLLRPARGRLECTATVLKPGRMFSIVEAEVHASGALVAKLIATMAVVDKPAS
jgi:uncharacterized protein (TIGR00369 family)